VQAGLPIQGGAATFTLRRFELNENIVSTVVDNGPFMGQAVNVPMININGFAGAAIAPVDIARDSFEVWEFINNTIDTHPMHAHLVQFRVLSRSAIINYDLPQAPEDYESGWKDTVRAFPNQATRVLMRFDGGAGSFMYHCHILEHEDMGMMGTFTVE
jgi:FtsP/CotA-like multicopper oxidase with cupredoxin domain